MERMRRMNTDEYEWVLSVFIRPIRIPFGAFLCVLCASVVSRFRTVEDDA